ncbi:MAG TPA: hypothetical protein VHB79_27565 [Polyangiaceae bacterium]|nr:hypothetical protein [Polyangiaceae bacterium]
MRSCFVMLSLLAVGCTPAMMPHLAHALVELAAAMPQDVEAGDETERQAPSCYRRVLVALLPARKVTAAMRADDTAAEAVALLPVVTREVRTACAPHDAGPH